MFKCESLCVCGTQLVMCEPRVVTRIQKGHREEYGLPFPTPNNEWVARCRCCGRHYLISGHNSPEGESITLYRHFFYHSIIAWNRWHRLEAKLGRVTLRELELFWRENMPELTWKAAMVNAFEFEEKEFSTDAKRKKSFVFGQGIDALSKDAPFRKKNDLALTIPHIE